MKVNVAGRVDQIQFVRLAFIFEIDRDGTGFDRNASFPLDVQIVEDLLFELPLSNRSRLKQKLIGERALAVVNMGNDGKVTD